MILNTNIGNAIDGLIYEKALKFSLTRSVEHSLGSLVNHIQVDSMRLQKFGTVVEGFTSIPMMIIMGFYFMYSAVGLSFFAGFGVIAVNIVVNIAIGKKLYQ